MHARRLAVAALTLVLPAVARAQQPTVPMPMPMPPAQVITNGRAEATVTPDRATVTVAVETRGATAAAASQSNAAIQQRVLAALRALGLPNERLGTSGFTVSPEMAYAENQSPRVTGYVARNAVRAQILDVATVGRVIDAALAAGATNIENVDFTASKMDDVRRTAMGEAVRGACLDAQALASASGLALGHALELSASYDMPGPRPMMAMARGKADVAESTPINAGNINVTVMVNARWALLPSGMRPDHPDAQRCK
jgi:uncharacterized protein